MSTKTGTKRRSRRTRRSGGHTREIVGVVVLVAGLILLLSLLSYRLTDYPAFDSAAGAPRNWMGRLGALLAWGMVTKMGRLPPFLTIGLILLWGWRILRRTADRRLVILSVQVLLVQVLLAVLLAFPHHLFNPDLSTNLAGEWGGWIAGVLTDYTGVVGAPLVWLVVVLIFAMVAFGLKPGELAAALARAGIWIGRVAAAAAGGVMALAKKVSTRRSAKKTAARPRRTARTPTTRKKTAGKPAEPAPAAETALSAAGDGTAAPPPGEEPLPPVGRDMEPAPAAVPEEGSGTADVPTPDKDDRPPALEPRTIPGSETYSPPPLDLFVAPSEDELGPDEEEVRTEAELLQEKLLSFGVRAEVARWKTGPVITRFELKPAPGVKVSQIVNLADDLALAMRAQRIRIVAPIPGEAAVGVEIPNARPRIVRLREVLESKDFAEGPHKLPLALGMDIAGAPVVVDLGGMPHLLLAGTTGSGKSVSINAIIASLLLRMGPEQCRFIMVDPKMLELAIYNAIPHLITPVVTDPRKAVDALRWAVLEMEQRYDRLAGVMVRDLEQYNTKVRSLRDAAAENDDVEAADVPEPLPYIIIVVDELADLMMTASADIETLIQRLAQKARAVGVHLILATQRPSVDVITGPIKANFSSRIAFQVPSKIDSRTILDCNGAEKLLGRGDLLFMNPSFPEPRRVHGSFISNEEIESLVNLVGGQELDTEEVDIFAPAAGDPGGMGAAGEALDDQLRDAAWIVVTHDQGSISLIQRRLGVGYTRAARMMDQLEMLGIVGPPDGTKAREVLLDEEDLEDISWGGR